MAARQKMKKAEGRAPLEMHPRVPLEPFVDAHVLDETANRVCKWNRCLADRWWRSHASIDCAVAASDLMTQKLRRWHLVGTKAPFIVDAQITLATITQDPTAEKG